ncbi:MAG: dTDP-4-dehydrorhamnose reductase [Pseudozobellia sp.]|nr:dTDP-4-dehydrorhamnose reductase [Pseudozobellia sp.]MBG49192.1 dTDP-4-dehydrorhamnose reductase [Pseudozobellia sp.]|tara:strand:+ start:1483342 stop:1484199 length:858 start_codon:yes stop_codon:yes gene_type:complete
MKNVLVTGGSGQLASLIRRKSKDCKELKFLFVDLDELDITSHESVSRFFEKYSLNYCINCAAYTAVDAAEENESLARRVNAEGAGILALNCSKHLAKMVQVSTDFVFNGTKGTPYKETDIANPLSIYGQTKLEGEELVRKNLSEHFILRTSWLYSLEGNNFLKTMLRLGKERDTLNVVNDQIGTPTYAGDLADIILNIIQTDSEKYGLYHYSNEGQTSWYGFASRIFELSGMSINLSPIPSKGYPTPATRPSYSVLDKAKIKKAFGIKIAEWEESLKDVLMQITS